MKDLSKAIDSRSLYVILTGYSRLLNSFLETNNVQAEEFNTDFSSWLPGYQKPATPCDYCRSKSLECFIYNTKPDGTSGCSPCNNLFRPCSFSNPELMPYRTQRTALDTLDVVGENDVHLWGGLTRRKQLRSKGHIGPIDDESGDLGPKKGAAAARFPRAAVKILKDWSSITIILTPRTKRRSSWVNRLVFPRVRFQTGWQTHVGGKKRGPSEALLLAFDHQQKPSTFHRAGLGSH
jgi:hypothetical protein